MIADAALGMLVLAGSLALLAHQSSGTEPGAGRAAAPLGEWAVAVAIASSLPLVAWRRAPLFVFALSATSVVVGAAFGLRSTLALGPLVALFLLAAAWTPTAGRRRAAVVPLTFGAGWLAVLVAGAGVRSPEDLAHAALPWALAWFAGDRTRLRREQIRDLQARALAAEREAARDRELALAQERDRIARDLHDAAGHAISVIAVRAGAARLRGADPERALAALAAIEELARDTAAEIDHFVGALRSADRRGRDAPGYDRVPVGTAFLTELMDRHRAAGLDVRFTSSGPARALPPAADPAAFRIVQESLTNSARHGTGTAAVEFVRDEGGLAITVRNPVRYAAPPCAGARFGLVGMQERADLVGGTLHAEREGEEFVVRARIPHSAAPLGSPTP
ncbi:MAG: sensor histidine kinase [Sporichthyaceae bacterium]